MNVDKKNLEKSQVELNVELTYEEFKPYITEGTKKVSEETQVEGFRPGKAPYDVLKQKVGEMTILEKAARLAVNDTVDQAISDNLESQPVGQPRVDITKLAPNESMQYKVVVALLPEAELGDYKNLEVEPEEPEVTDKEVEDTLENLRERQATEESVDREVQEGDKVILDIDMYQNEVPVEGGQSRDTAIILGQQNLVPGFDDNILGAKKNEEKEFSLTYPEEHHQKNLAGKSVGFKVVIKDLYERNLPEINDEFAQNLGVNTLEELKKMVRESLRSQKQEEAQQKTESKLVDKVIENSKFGDIPEVLANNEAETMVNEMEQTVKNQGGTFEDYLSSIGKTKEQLMLDLTPDAIKRVKSALVIREIANKENIEVTEEEVDNKQNELLEQYKGYEKVEERVKQDSYRHYLNNIIANRKVIDKLKEWNLPEKDSQEEPQQQEGPSSDTSQQQEQVVSEDTGQQDEQASEIKEDSPEETTSKEDPSEAEAEEINTEQEEVSSQEKEQEQVPPQQSQQEVTDQEEGVESEEESQEEEKGSSVFSEEEAASLDADTIAEIEGEEFLSSEEAPVDKQGDSQGSQSEQEEASSSEQDPSSSEESETEEEKNK